MGARGHRETARRIEEDAIRRATGRSFEALRWTVRLVPGLKVAVVGLRYPMWGAREYIKTAKVPAQQRTAAFSERTQRGESMEGKAGDWVTINSDGSTGVIDDAVFQATYAAISGEFSPEGWQLYQKTVPALAVRYWFFLPFRLATLEGPMTVRRGDWILQGPSGDQWPRQHPFMTQNYMGRDGIHIS